MDGNKSTTRGKLDRSLIAYAFLAQATRSEGDLLAGLAPIFKPIAKLYAGKQFEPAQFAKAVSEIYGLKVNSWAIEELAPRLANAGLLTKTAISDSAHRYIYAEIAQEYDEVTDKHIAHVTQRFVQFATPLLQQYSQHIDAKQLEEALLRQLIDMEFVGILLKPERVTATARSVPTGGLKTKEEIEWEKDIEMRSRIDVLCAAFILDTYHKDKSLYDLIVRLATGALVAEVVLNFQNPDAKVSLQGLTLILDTPFLMAALNVSGEEMYQVASSICDQLRENGAQLAVFDHSVEELKGNLKAVISAAEVGEGYGPTARRLPSPVFRAYASAIMQSPEARFKQDSIRIIPSPKSSTAYQFFTQEDQDEFEHSLGYGQTRKLRRERDAASIAVVMRLRMNKKARMSRFQTAGYLFLTSNPLLVERSQEFLRTRKLYADGDVPPAITDRNLAGLLWVLYGGKSIELPQHVLLANCAKAVEPRSDVIQQMHRFLADLDGKQAEYFRALMTEERAGQYLMQLTLGESAFLTNENAPIVLEQIKHALIEKNEAEKRTEIANITEEYQAELQKAHRAQEELRNRLREANSKVFETTQELNETTRRVDTLEQDINSQKVAAMEQKRRLADRCVRIAWMWTNVTHVAMALIIATVGGVVTWYSMQQTPSPLVKAVSTAVIAGLAFISFWKIPDLLFSAPLNRLRVFIYEKKLGQYGLDADQGLFEVDWRIKRASLKHQLDKSQ